MHLTSAPIDWYAARAAGLTAYLLLTGVVLLGLTMAAKKTFPAFPRFTVEDIHRFGGILVGSFIVVHVVTIAVDSWLPFSLASLLVPFVSRYRPLWVGLGVAAMELLAALAIANHYRNRLRHTTWRRLHYLNFAVWVAATLHGLGSGTDRSAPWAIALYTAATAAVAAAVVWRLARVRELRYRAGFAGLAAALTVLLVAGLGVGPLHFRPKAWNAPRFSEPLTGHIAQLNGVSRGIVSMAGEGHGTQSVLVRADLLVAPRKLLTTAFQMEYLPSAVLCKGTVTSVHSVSFTARCRLPDGAGRSVEAHWELGESADIVGGVISGHP
jgi:sulfoxide reductase heme-binding subunit YedZ